MRIADSASSQIQQFVRRTTASPARQVSDVSREERLQLLTGRQLSQRSGTAPDTYSERAQLLSVSSTTNQSWVV